MRGSGQDLRAQLTGINPQPHLQRHRRQQVERVRGEQHTRGDQRRGAVQDLNRRQPGRYRISGMLARWQRLRRCRVAR